MTGETLDLHPNKWEYNEKLKAIDTSNWTSTPYIANEYAIQPEKTPFQLGDILYSGRRIEGIILNPMMVKSVLALYNTDRTKLLAFCLCTEEKYHYYANKNTTVDVTETTFTVFSLDSKPDIGVTKKLLENIDENNGIDPLGLLDTCKEIAIKLFKDTDIIFDLNKHPSGDLKKKETYVSHTNGANVVIDDPRPLGNKFVSVDHITSPFTVCGIKFKKKNITVEGGFPDVIFTEFDAYYRRDDNDYDDPLLIILKVQSSHHNTGHIVGRCFLSKNAECKIWNILKVAGFEISDRDIEEILDNIVKKTKFEISGLTSGLQSRLRDGTTDLIIDIEMIPKKDSDTYNYGGNTVHYRKSDIGEGCFLVEHAHNFQTFTIKKIRIEDKSLDTTPIPSSKVLVSLFNVYYSYKVATYPLLIYILYGETQTWLRRFYGDVKWEILGSQTLATRDDLTAIRRILNDSSIPNVAIDFGRTRTTMYYPSGTSLKFRIDRAKVQKSGYYGFKHSRLYGQAFKIKSIVCGTKQLKGINSNVEWESISAYYWGSKPLYEKLLVVQLGDKDKDCYSYGGDDNWIQTDGSLRNNLLGLIDNANCNINKAHVIDLGSKKIYDCQGCGTGITVHTIYSSLYNCYEHTITGDGSSISNFKDGNSYDTGIPEFENFSTVYVYWSLQNFDKPFLIHISGYHGDKHKELPYDQRWYWRVEKVSNRWIKLGKKHAPKVHTESTTILKILNGIQGERRPVKILKQKNVEYTTHQVKGTEHSGHTTRAHSDIGLGSRAVISQATNVRDNTRNAEDGQIVGSRGRDRNGDINQENAFGRHSEDRTSKKTVDIRTDHASPRNSEPELEDLGSRINDISLDSDSREDSFTSETSDNTDSDDTHISHSISDWFQEHAITIGSAGAFAVAVPAVGVTAYCCIKNRKV
ncbi:hypothetical protein BEWA_026160 [Theileria equi strain WA]|uniref:Uncharacterized protein n=1 Tax=Theileria equi strain WA TaxID=1537102 RepID=L0AVY6_THEEQ|nr:hypothetical protein BEWA_026160 [Theileria equi strain WA]AFZ79767.1 hypothetical protein BEWA_026160 [Theileria equi strain WA]|eukprot:XP_004829433.1 hypothetical protein BEWA_026160 [Theileria equi strain WA]